MRFTGLTILVLFAAVLLTSCGGGDYSGKIDKSGVAGPQNPTRGDAPPPGEGPAATEVRYTEQTDGVVSRDFYLKSDTTFIVTLHGYDSKDAKIPKTQRWDTNLRAEQTSAILEGCSYETMSKLKAAMPEPAQNEVFATIDVRFTDGQEITVQAGKGAPPPNEFRAIAHALTELAKEKVADKSIKPVVVED
jgi:hypothetical protein